jgi:hypothetical protein
MKKRTTKLYLRPVGTGLHANLSANLNADGFKPLPVMANEYLVAPLSKLPRWFDELPAELQGLVLKNTAASFEVTQHDNEWVCCTNLERVPVIVRYQFKLQ